MRLLHNVLYYCCSRSFGGDDQQADVLVIVNRRQCHGGSCMRRNFPDFRLLCPKLATTIVQLIWASSEHPLALLVFLPPFVVFDIRVSPQCAGVSIRLQGTCRCTLLYRYFGCQMPPRRTIQQLFLLTRKTTSNSFVKTSGPCITPLARMRTDPNFIELTAEVCRKYVFY